MPKKGMLLDIVAVDIFARCVECGIKVPAFIRLAALDQPNKQNVLFDSFDFPNTSVSLNFIIKVSYPFYSIHGSAIF